jgi:aldose 1-epimerase
MMTPRPFGTFPSGESVEEYTLSNRAGASATVLTLGGIVTSLKVPDREGRSSDIVLGFNDLGSYSAGHPYFGAIIGRIAGRVTAGRIWIEGQGHVLACNERGNHLHGGLVGLDKRVWTAQPLARASGDASLRLSYRSPDGEEGYPGAVEIRVTYTLTAKSALIVESEASSDRPTPLSLAHHSYFNLAGEGSGDVLGHEVQILAEEYVPTGESLVLTDLREGVAGRGADLRTPRLLRDALQGLAAEHGDNYLLRGPGAPQPFGPTLAARVTERGSGRVLEVYTDDSCLQFYTGSMLDGTLVGKSGRPYGRHAGLCLECHGYPNATSVDTFGDILVRPEGPQRRLTIYAFSTN